MFRNNIHPREDAYISQYYADKNFGGSAYLYTNRYNGAQDEYQSLLKFNIGFFDGFEPCCPDDHYWMTYQLRLKVYRNEIPASATLYVHQVLEDWNEYSVTWNNKPAIDPTPLGSAVVTAGYFGWVDISFDNLAHCGLDQGLLIKCDQPGNSLLGFYSREYSDPDYWPQLHMRPVRRRFPCPEPEEKPVITIHGPVATLPSNLIRVGSECEDCGLFFRDSDFCPDCLCR